MYMGLLGGSVKKDRKDQKEKGEQAGSQHEEVLVRSFGGAGQALQHGGGRWLGGGEMSPNCWMKSKAVTTPE